MAKIFIDENEGLEKGLKRFKRMREREGIVRAFKNKQFYTKPSDERREKKILALTSTGSVEEYVLLYQVSYRVLNNKMEDLVAPNDIALQRTMTYQDTETLAKESEEQFLYRDMQADAVNQMLRRLSVIAAAT